MDHLAIVAVMALVPLGAWVAMGEGMALHWLYKIIERLPKWVNKPLGTCPRCMCSAWGIPAALVTFADLNPWLLPLYLFAAVGLQEAVHK